MKGGMKHCCEAMQRQVEFECEKHPDRFDCADALVAYAIKFDEYGLIIHDGGSSVITIDYCPWCGKKLPESKRYAWFNAIEKLGLDPGSDDIPDAYQSDKWYRD
jgi:hypothetical protein